MAGAFDDLIPGGAPSSSGGFFDDLTGAVPPWLKDVTKGGPWLGLLNAQTGGKVVPGLGRGVRDVIDFGAEAAASGVDKLSSAFTGISPRGLNDQVSGSEGGFAGPLKAQNAADLRAWEKANNDNVGGHLARVGGQMLTTAPVGGIIAAPIKWAATSPMIAPLIGRAGPYLTALAESVNSGGMKTGMQAEAAREAARAAKLAEKLTAAELPVPAAVEALAANPTTSTLAQKAADVGMRAVGGGITGYASGGMTGGAHGANFGGGFGAALPVGFRGFGAGFNAVAPKVQAMFKTPQIAADAASILKAGGYTDADIPALRAALEQRGPTIVQATRPEGGGSSTLTTAQVLMNPGISQLSRTLNNMHNVGMNPQLEALEMQQAAQRAALDRLGPTHGSVNDTRNAFGAVAQPGIVGADAKARDTTSRAFTAVDPAGDARIFPPIEEMTAASREFLNPAIFKNSPAEETLKVAREIGSETFEPVAQTAGAASGAPKQGQTLVQIVRSMGGIDTYSKTGQLLAGELRDLRQTKGMRGIVRDGGGKSPEKIAEELHQRGLLPDDDPATLLNHLRDPDLGGASAYADDQERVWAALSEHAMGDAPGELTLPRVVSFKDAQDLRALIGEKAREQAGPEGSAKAKAALEAQRRALDAKVAELAGGNVQPGEYFPLDMQQQWRKAIQLKKDQVNTFRTGPQAGLFRDGSDNLPVLNGGELAPAFFNKSADQSTNIAGFNKVATPETTGLLKAYAVRDAFDTHDAKGLLTSKYGDWLSDHSGAVEGLFTPGERAQLSSVADSVKRAAAARDQGIAPGSPTAKNILGLGVFGEAAPVAEQASKFALSQLPVFGRPLSMLGEHLSKGSKASEIGRLSHLMSDPQMLEDALRQLQLARAAVPLTGSASAADIARRALPLLGGRL